RVRGRHTSGPRRGAAAHARAHRRAGAGAGGLLFHPGSLMGVLARYWERLPVSDRTPMVDLREGSTPLVPSRNVGPALGLARLFFKYEGLNPTGSFKDRGMVVAVAKAMEAGARVLVCASTGNTSASAAAYAASQRLRAIVVVPDGEIALNKLAQALMYGAKVVQIQGNFDAA